MKNRIVILLLLLCLVPGAGKAKKNRTAAPFFFIQLTDPQFGFIDANKGFEKETALFEKAVAAINRLKPDFVVITGDFVNDTKDGKQSAEFKRLTATIDAKIPVYLTPGNHDIGHEVDKISLESYKKTYGPDHFSFRNKNAQFIGFNSCLIKSGPLDLEQNQYKWLEKTLLKNGNADHIILFCHYPFFIKTMDEPEEYANISIENRKKYLNLFAENKVEAIFAGHLHHNALTSYGNIQMIATSAVGKQIGEDSSGLRIVKVYADRIEHQYFGLDEIPEKVTF